MGGHFHTLLFIIGVVTGSNFVSHQKDYYVPEYFIQDMMNKLNKDLSVEADEYLGIRQTSSGLEPNQMLNNRVIKELDNVDPESDMEGPNYNSGPSIRDQEYLQHSSLWGDQFGTGETAKEDSNTKLGGTDNKIKSDGTLPAYCNPPNPCPVGYMEEDGCVVDFENTAAFSRDFQNSQDCMCDSEHMFECSDTVYRSRNKEYNNNNIDLDKATKELSGKGQHKNLVAKKYHFKKNQNPFLVGDRLPVAAKKGINLFGG